MITRRQLLANSLLSALYAASPATASNPTTTAWRNWSGHVHSSPAGRHVPATEDELQAFLASTTGAVRPVGSGHSFTELVPTDGHLVVIDRLTGMLDYDSESNRATFAAGTRLGDMGAPLAEVGQSMINLPDIDRQTLAGATATASHGTGITFKSLSGYITSLRLITPAGDIKDLSATSEPDLFNAARVSLGALGIVTQIGMQNQGSFRLKQTSSIARIEDVLDQFDELTSQHRHFEIFPLTHSNYAIALATDETDEATNNPIASPEEDAVFDNIMRGWMEVAPKDRQPLVDALAEQTPSSERVDVSYKILTNIRNSRFNEMEYSVPVEAGGACLREVLQTIKDREIDTVMPLEYRYVRRDDTLLGMSSGDHDHAAISIHRVASEDYRPYFDLIEPIFWKYGGRPHWGKVHSLGAPQLAKLYPRFKDFQALRQQLDPTGRMLNPHLRRVFGVEA